MVGSCKQELLVMEALFIADWKPTLSSQEEGIEIECQIYFYLFRRENFIILIICVQNVR